MSMEVIFSVQEVSISEGSHCHKDSLTSLNEIDIISLARTIREGAIGNYVSFEDCVFEGNTAVEYGGAVGLILPSANVIFDSRENIRPIMFDNW